MKSLLPPDRASWLLLAALLCCVLEGAMRKWLVGDASLAARAAYFSKDIAFIAIIGFGIPTSNRLARLSKPFLTLGLGLTTLGGSTSAVSGVSPVGAVLSIRSMFLLPLIAWIVGQCLPQDSLKRIALWVALISMPLAVLGVLQFYAPSESFLNRYSTEGEYVSTTGFDDRVRATGTFSYITGFSIFANVAVWGGIVSLTLARTPQERLLGASGVAAGFCCTFVTVSRASALISLGLVLIWAVFGGEISAKIKSMALVATLLTISLLVTGWGTSAAEIASAVRIRSERSNDGFLSRLHYTYVMPLHALERAPLGAGFGFEQAGRRAYGAAARMGSTYESALGRVIMETGVLGLIGTLVCCGACLLPPWLLYRDSNDPALRTATAVTGAMALTLVVIGTHFNHVASFFLWLLAALILSVDNAGRPRIGNASVLRPETRLC